MKAGLLLTEVSLLISSLLLPYQNDLLVLLRISTDLLFFVGTLVLVAYLLTAAIRGSRASLVYLLVALLLLLGYLDFVIITLFNIRLYYFLPGNIIIGSGIEITLLTAIFVTRISRKRNFSLLQRQNQENQRLSGGLITAQGLHDSLGAYMQGQMQIDSFSKGTAFLIRIAL